MKPYHYIFLSFIILISVLLYIPGINWGLPSKERSDMVLPADLRNNEFYQLMKNTRDDIYKYNNNSPMGRVTDDANKSLSPIMVSMNMKKDEVFIFSGDIRTLANFVRPYLLRSNHSDEQMALVSLSKMNFRKLDLNPRFFQYGGSYIYSLGVWILGLKIMGMITISSDIVSGFANPAQIAGLFTAARFFNVIAVILSIIIIFLITKTYVSANAGLLAALFFGASPAVVCQVHILKPYCISAMLALACLYFAVKINQEPEKLKNCILSGLMAGLCIGSMAFNGLFILAPITAILLSSKNKLKSLSLLFTVTLATFLITNPYWLLDYKGVIFDLKQFSSREASTSFNLFIFSLFHQLPQAAGSCLLITYLAGIYLALKNRTANDIVMIISGVIPLLVFTWMFKYPFLSIHNARFIIPCIGVFAVLSARFIDYSLNLKRVRLLAIALILICTFQAITYSYIITNNFVLDSSINSTRIQAGKWIMENIPERSNIAIFDLPTPGNMPPFDFRKYTISAFSNRKGFENADYLVTAGAIPDSALAGGFVPVKIFSPVKSSFGIKYDFGISPVNIQVNIFKNKRRK